MRRAMRITAFVLLGLIGLVVLALAALHTTLAGDRIAGIVEDATGGEARLEGLRLSGLLNIRLDRARYQPTGADEPMVEAEGLVLDWSPLALLGGTAKIDTISADRLRYSDVALPPSDEEEEPDTGGGLPQLPVSIVLQNLSIGTLELAAPSFGLESSYTLNGRADVDQALSEASLDIKGDRLDGEGALSVSVDYGADRDRIVFAIRFEDQDGAPLAALTGIDGGALTVRLEGEGPIERTDQTLYFEMAKGPKAEGAWTLAYADRLGIDGTLSVEPRGFGGPEIAQYAGPRIDLRFKAALEDGDLSAQLSTPLRGEALSADLEAAVSGALDDALGFDLALANVSGTDIPVELAPLALTLKGEYDLEAGKVVLDPSTITSPNGLAVTLSGDVNLAGPMDLDLVADIEKLETFAPDLFGRAAVTAEVRGPKLGLPVAVTLDGTARIRTQAEGAESPVELTAEARVSEEMALDAVLDLGVSSLAAVVPDRDASFTSKLEVSGTTENLSGVLNARASADGETLTVRAPFGYTPEAVTIENLRLSGLGVEGAGGGRFALDSGTPVGELNLTIEDLAALAALAGMEASGRVALVADLRADGQVAAKTTIENLSLPSEGVAISVLNAVIEPQGGGMQFTVDAKADAPVDAVLKSSGDARLGEATEIRLASLEGVVNEVPFKLNAPAQFRMEGEEMAVNALNLAIAGGRVEGGLSLGADSVAGDIKLIGITLPDTYTGGVKVPVFARLQATGTRAAPDLKLQAQIKLDHESLDDAVIARLDAAYRDAQARAALTMSGASSDFKATLNAPAQIDLNAMTAELTGTAALDADGKFALAALEPFVLGDGSRFGGFLAVTSTARSAGEDFTADVSLCFDQAMLDLAATGTVVSSLDGCLKRDPKGAVAAQLTARDREQGTIKIALDGSLLGEKPDAISGTVGMKNFRLMDSDLGIVEASSDLKLDARLDEGLAGGLKGSVTVNRGDLLIPGNPGPSVETIEVRHVGRPGDAEAEEQKALGAPFGEDFKLELTLGVPGNFFVRGRGLESEWEGGLGVKGTLAAPVIDGTIELKKGHANAGVSTLELTDGEIRLFTQKPGTPPVVLIMLESESSVEGTVARMRVEGPVEDPEVTFSSDPELPQDEILARLIFGKPASELTATEAAQLGSAALTLSGALGGGPGVFDKIRRGLGVDRIAFDPSIDNPASSSVTVGKYVTPKVYVSVKQDASGAAPGIAVDYEVTRRITLSAEDDGAGGESAGVKYEFDY